MPLWILSRNMKEVTKEQLETAARAILNDELVVYPTETAYGLGANALSQKALERMYELKGRRESKPTHICVPDITTADEYAKVDDRALALADAFLPGPLTLVMPTKRVLPELIEKAGGEERSIRIPDHDVIRQLMQLTGVPITAASANRADFKTPYSVEEVKEGFGENAEKIAVYLDAGKLPFEEPSTIVSLMGDELVILREGPISLEQIKEVLDDAKD